MPTIIASVFVAFALSTIGTLETNESGGELEPLRWLERSPLGPAFRPGGSRTLLWTPDNPTAILRPSHQVVCG